MQTEVKFLPHAQQLVAVVNTNDYASGMYLINVEGPNGQFSKKVLR